MRDITVLHPAAQYRAPLLVQKCAEQGIRIKIGECYRTVKEQDDKYAQGRTAPGIIVTKCKGSTYSSMHQWYIAFDVFLDMDIDGDGKTSDDSYNDKLSTFRKIGKIGESIGLEWGGDWRSVTDKPHFSYQTGVPHHSDSRECTAHLKHSWSLGIPQHAPRLMQCLPEKISSGYRPS
jgi:peptidoglycan L-alanyl-D-glutamate endopeptidase CwlK